MARFLICLIAVCADIQLNQTRSLTLCNDNNKVSTSNYKTNIRIVIIWFAYCTAGFNRCRKRSQISFILQKHLFFWVHYQNIFCWKTIEVISNEMIFDENPPVFIISLSIFLILQFISVDPLIIMEWLLLSIAFYTFIMYQTLINRSYKSTVPPNYFEISC